MIVSIPMHDGLHVQLRDKLCMAINVIAQSNNLINSKTTVRNPANNLLPLTITYYTEKIGMKLLAI